MGLKNTKTIGFNFKNERMEVLEMDIDFQREVPMNAARWDLWPEFMIESDEEQEDRHLLLIDLFLKLLPDTEAPPFALIRTRHRVHLYDIPARYVSDEVIALFLNNFVSQVRGYLKGFSMDHLHDLPHVHLLDPEELFRMVNVGSSTSTPTNLPTKGEYWTKRSICPAASKPPYDSPERNISFPNALARTVFHWTRRTMTTMTRTTTNRGRTRTRKKK